MPTHKVKGGKYQWGKHGKIYPTKTQADKQGRAIYANGWKENKVNEEKYIIDMKRTITLTESDLKKVIKESVTRILRESNESEYTHFAVNKNTNLIVNGWDYSGYDSSELNQFKNDYFYNDLIDNDFNPKDYKILTRKSCIRLGINPDDIENCWSNRGEIPCGEENKLKEPINEISADLAFKAANSAYQKAREGYGKYNNTDEIPHDSYHGKKFAQGEKFLTYGRNKLNKGNNDVGIYYIGDKIALKNYKTGEFLTKPCNSIEELEFEINNK